LAVFSYYNFSYILLQILSLLHAAAGMRSRELACISQKNTRDWNHQHTRLSPMSKSKWKSMYVISTQANPSNSNGAASKLTWSSIHSAHKNKLQFPKSKLESFTAKPPKKNNIIITQHTSKHKSINHMLAAHTHNTISLSLSLMIPLQQHTIPSWFYCNTTY
jgi:hypothetical protein